MTGYRFYRPDSNGKVAIEERGTKVSIEVRRGAYSAAMLLPEHERRNAAKALAGDEYIVLARDTTERRTGANGLVAVDPDSVARGERVFVEANDGSWSIAGKVVAVTDALDQDEPFTIAVGNQASVRPNRNECTVYAERPAIDEAKARAWQTWIDAQDDVDESGDIGVIAKMLARADVPVPFDGDDEREEPR